MKKLILNYKIFNGILFYITWYACIYGAALDFEMLGVGTGVILTALHFYFSDSKVKDLIYLGIFLLIGLFGDWILLGLNVISYPVITYDITKMGVPLWVLMIYISFSTTINHSLVFIHRFPLLAALSGGLGGSISYFLATRINAISLPLGALSLFAIGVYWFLILIATKVIYDYIEMKIPASEE